MREEVRGRVGNCAPLVGFEDRAGMVRGIDGGLLGHLIRISSGFEGLLFGGCFWDELLGICGGVEWGVNCHTYFVNLSTLRLVRYRIMK